MPVWAVALAAILGAIAAVVTIAWFAWTVLRPPATKTDIRTLEQQIKELEKKVIHPPEYLDGLPQAVDDTLRAAYQEARILQLEGYQAQGSGKHRDAIDRFIRALSLAENDTHRAALHLLRGNSYLSLSSFPQAKDDYRTALGLAKALPAQDCDLARAAALNNLGTIYQDTGQLKDAEECHRSALAIWRERGVEVGEATALGNLGIVHRMAGTPQALHQAKGEHEASLAIHRRIGNRHGEASQLGELGNVCMSVNDWGSAQAHFFAALSIDGELGHDKGLAASLSSLGVLFRRRGSPENLDLAEQCCTASLEIHTRMGDRLGQANQLLNLGNIRLARDDRDSAEKLYGDALGLYQSIDVPIGVARALVNLGVLAVSRGQLAAGFGFMNRGLRLYDELGNEGAAEETRQTIAQVERRVRASAIEVVRSSRRPDELQRKGDALNGLGTLYHVRNRRGDDRRAERYYRWSLDIFERLGNGHPHATVLVNLGLLCADRGDLDRAEEYFKQALDIYRRIDNPLGQADILGNLGSVYEDLGDPDRAEEHHKQALQIDRRIDKPLGQAGQLANLGLVAERRGQPHEARRLFREALDLSERTGAGGRNVEMVRAALRRLEEAGRKEKPRRRPRKRKDQEPPAG